MKNIWIYLFNFAAKKIGYVKNEYTQEQIKLINRLKVQFKIYFEGWEYEDAIGGDYIHISKFEITDFDFKFKNNELIWKIILNRPGFLIGKGGRTIDGLKEYLNSSNENWNIKIDLEESKLWGSLKS